MPLFNDPLDYTVLERTVAEGNQNPATNVSPGTAEPSLWGRITDAFSDFAGNTFEAAALTGSRLTDYWAFETRQNNLPIGFTDQGDMSPVAGQIVPATSMFDAKWLLVGGVAIVGLFLLMRR